MKTIEETYKKKDLHQHVLDRPDSYIGATKIVCEETFVYKDTKIVKEIIEYNPGLLKIFDEILVNAIDHSVKDSSCSKIKVNIGKDYVTVFNDGVGIPIVKHKEYDVYIPEMIFGTLLTGTNYDDSQQRITGGLNGLGAKLCNIYSKKFIVDIVSNGVHYYQTFSDNMYTKTEPKIKKSTKKPYTQITFYPDFKRFGYKTDTFTKDMDSLIRRRVADTTANTRKDVSVYLDDTLLKYKDFQQYISLFTDKKVIYEKYENGEYIWEYGVVIIPENHDQMSFVNGINTSKGGKHVDYILNQICKKLSEQINTKKKDVDIKPYYVKDKIFLFLRSTVANPSFSSQSKEFLTTPYKDFGVNIQVSEQFVNKLYKTEIVNDVLSLHEYKNKKELAKTNTSTKKTLKIPKLEDAYNAGKKRGCTLILTEGDSAKTFAISGLSVIGRENYGVFPLRGKLLNVREATQKQLLSNEEVNNLKQIIGLQHGKKYTTTDTLRYSRILLLTDADLDGVHIRCLLVNMFEVWWPELLEIKGFLTSMKTPIVKASKGKEALSFFSIKDFKDWEENHSNWNIKYYKGLGTSTASESKEIFKDMHKNTTYYISDEDTTKVLALAFDKKMANDRKRWLTNYNFDMTLDQANTSEVLYKDLINKELIHFSMYDIHRSIPSICDGLKPSQRKVLFTMFKKKYQKEIKVAQLGASVAELTSYHHGEASLMGTIINMAQDYPGANNINLLKPNGQFGSRTANGHDSASPRYIFTELNEITNKIFIKEDSQILEYLVDENVSIEPRYYVPIIPMVLVNGAQGIGTGYSTFIPSYNPVEIVANMVAYVNGKGMKKLTPYYKGYTGKITDNVMYGVYSRIDDKTLEISEIPVYTSIDDYQQFLGELTDYGINRIKNMSSENKPLFRLTFDNKSSLDTFMKLDVYKTLKLTKNISCKNFHLISEDGVIKHYADANEILKHFIEIRLKFNLKRKAYLVEKYHKELGVLENKIRFLTEIMESKLNVYRVSKKDIETSLVKRGYQRVDGNYNYLVNLPIHTFTSEKLKELNDEKEKVSGLYEETKNKTKNSMMVDDLKDVYSVLN